MDKVLLITGASRGIGAATARLAAGRGYAVCVNYRRNRDAADAVVQDIQAAGARAVAVAADVAVEADVVRLFETCDAALGPPAALVNNAGILETQMRVDAMDAARLARIFATNVIGAFVCAREAVRRMSTRYGGAGGAIVNVSSGASRLGSPGRIRRLRGLERGARHADHRPGARSGGGRHPRERRACRVHLHRHSCQRRRAQSGRSRQGARADETGRPPGEVAAAILWLLSDEASYTTGAFIDVAGGK